MSPLLARTILGLVEASPVHRTALAAVAALGLPDCWIAAGFIRGIVWDAAHGFDRPTPAADVDVVYFDPLRMDRLAERAIERRLHVTCPGLPWSVKNQARMHLRNDDRPYRSTADALWHWGETPTAIGIRQTGSGGLTLVAPFGLDDLFGLVVRPTPHFRESGKMDVYRARVAGKGWKERWPRVTIVME